ncbi:hypothetical protein NQ318_009032 [Aromia moschata]|uniref:Ankyrin repeat domain-containing protein n=1 Tax=Aromia moschata TaxID=1265417 RepID=A0AAV8YUD7_9CUCU|nr:hypothetical protein NQ318_009032 [Aromia moschata]
MIYNVIHGLHSFLMSHMLEWCTSYQTLHLTMWLCLVITFYVIIAGLLKMLSLFKYREQNGPLSFCKAIEENDLVSCVRLIENYPQYINKFTSDGADITLKSNKNESPFYLATFYYIKYPQYKNATCIRELYYSGADINEPNGNGFTPLQLAAMFGHTPLVKWLLLKNASTNCTPDPYLIATTQGHQDTARLIWKFTTGFSLKYK